jgi:hypothetical protein
MKKFNDSDIFVSTLKVYPKVKFFGYSGSIYCNNSLENNVKLNDFLMKKFPPPDCGILAENRFFLQSQDGNYLIIDNCEIEVPANAFATEDEQILITEDDLYILSE